MHFIIVHVRRASLIYIIFICDSYLFRPFCVHGCKLPTVSVAIRPSLREGGRCVSHTEPHNAARSYKWIIFIVSLADNYFYVHKIVSS